MGAGTEDKSTETPLIQKRKTKNEQTKELKEKTTIFIDEDE